MDDKFNSKLKHLIEYRGLPYRIRKELEKGQITKELLDESMYYLDSKHIVLAWELYYSLSDDESTYESKDKLAESRFPNQQWHENYKRNFISAMDEKIKQHGDLANLARLVSEQVGISQRNAERYLTGELQMTAETILMFEEILGIHRDELLGEFPSSVKKSPKNINNISIFRKLFDLMRSSEMIRDDLKNILKELYKLYSEIIRTQRDPRAFISSLDISKRELVNKINEINLKTYETTRSEILKAIEEIKSKTTT
jgi:hypothetical protein